MTCNLSSAIRVFVFRWVRRQNNWADSQQLRNASSSDLMMQALQKANLL
jgi:predicted DNA-binding ribbon-helix-helix protein